MLLDIAELKKEAYSASRTALDAIRSECAGERLYSFALVTTGLFGYVFPTANTEERLRLASERYISETKDFDGQIDMAMKYGRWEPTAFWRCHGKHNEAFRQVNALLDAAGMEQALCKLPKDEFAMATRDLESALLDVLKKLRSDGCFGTDPDAFYANICYQDQAYQDLYRCALRVNAGVVCQQMGRDLDDVLAFWRLKKGEAD
jgi:hypothetical protein